MYLDWGGQSGGYRCGYGEARQKHPEGAILYTLYPKDVLLQTMPSLPSRMTGEDGKSVDVK